MKTWADWDVWLGEFVNRMSPLDVVIATLAICAVGLGLSVWALERGRK